MALLRQWEEVLLKMGVCGGVVTVAPNRPASALLDWDRSSEKSSQDISSYYQKSAQCTCCSMAWSFSLLEERTIIAVVLPQLRLGQFIQNVEIYVSVHGAMYRKQLTESQPDKTTAQQGVSSCKLNCCNNTTVWIKPFTKFSPYPNTSMRLEDWIPSSIHYAKEQFSILQPSRNDRWHTRLNASYC